ncbi:MULTISPECIES: type I-F CRISPR-associated endoribonuclease Cas6/Csy4 [Photorhabdus]|nr:type I-F CRISPR-associated endoribonuclease Cas6/Csy4 [Photorhabdus bodei]MCC8384335.1 type I-F CRISPR-associated endoribonuclease Cas6/Csy4 [Photorhabdus laumondii]MCT8352495.1 type I-F CRISPR-associated endoribonuclease Cas6/Csy4 [Photorhabdus kayaii]MCC8388916.1 type I-F CRISPR-associated endoribonuclease Cas6/Csy4 [Photorhabdus laumondii]MCC8413163.1 type I-F CRISPR-associated endoribonuclease Cas6/Csy4 [Photorhabdus laumondii]
MCLKNRFSGQTFSLIVEQGPIEDRSAPGFFSCFVLNKSTTVPWF